MPECKKWRNIDTCGGHLIKTNWLPRPGEDPLLREYKCIECGNITYMETGRLQKTESSIKDKPKQFALI